MMCHLLNMEIKLNQLNSLDWGLLIDEIQVRLILTQREIADRCKVSAQAVSAWRLGHRVPDMHGRRCLVSLAREAGIQVHLGSKTPLPENLEIAEEPANWTPSEKAGVKEMLDLIKEMPPATREKALSYLRFLKERNKYHDSSP